MYKKLYFFLEDYFNPTSNYKGFKKTIYNLLTPIFLLIEYLVFKHYWKNIILENLLSNESVVNFFYRNEFRFDKTRLVKMDLLEELEGKIDISSLRIAKESIRKEFILAFTKILQENIALDLENLITLYVDIKKKLVKSDSQLHESKIYLVYIQFHRLKNLKETKDKSKTWLIIVSIISLLIYTSIYFLS